MSAERLPWWERPVPILPPVPVGLVTPVAPTPVGPAIPHSPELLLVLAVLADAIDLLRGWAAGEPYEIRETLYWVEHGDVGSVTFNDTYTLLGCDPARARSAILGAYATGPMHDPSRPRRRWATWRRRRML